MKTKSILNYTTTYINRNFRLKVYGIDENGNRINKLVGVSGLIELIGEELLNKFVGRALRAGLDKVVCKLRRGLQVSFYIK
ncbi:ribosomal large subunit pseudouridine synthase B [Parabacteroides johnsonii]|uniref:ribosomal large subunit pseudouridine synthase B n=1 Tax=Parabacteroides johnsonii TaxID=387661 RepID=UPI00242FBE6F|nr:ribosomal large subunit pseudouridine synthase B [Parabacteroides johnsonii]